MEVVILICEARISEERLNAIPCIVVRQSDLCLRIGELDGLSSGLFLV